ncbi:MupA/Atu3671 family FMN-dependent luciferase-like monooxygenase [Sinorhizobium meliloti]|uniref:MupA/Atu3671 family FMN-dependent luciferase-like monooxygenase n=1 Tax=Rhizobium meliloti TaxID=382 RepID=UPI000FDBD08A|nr:MupA/Atu3671 family FMN-dependent luciferase-like monooxygenase [Sinorhizobium meliloti]RVK17013.1 LLM class flavin-dependent oxidoreductase [Sinorhizobium meliloti]
MDDRIRRRVSLASERAVDAVGSVQAKARPAVRLGIMFFPSNLESNGSFDYDRLFEIARLADEGDFSAVWIPERHFHGFGGASPNPSVLAAALAARTQRIGLRGGSVVLPLHDPIRIAEEWALVDALSNGRAGVAFGSGWHAVDFALAPERYTDRRRLTVEGVATVRALWRGESIPRRDGEGHPTDVRIYPRPVQPELPVWLTATGHPETFRKAGEIGAGVLTSLIGQSLAELEQKITVYRQARASAGLAAGDGCVTVMLHTHVSRDLSATGGDARQALSRYLAASMGLQNTALTDAQRRNRVTQATAAPLIERAVERYFEDSALIGSVDRCMAFLDRLGATGVDEIACLVDFGLRPELIAEGLAHLGVVQERMAVKTR